FALDRAHRFDLLFSRHAPAVASRLKDFRPDIIQITGPSDAGILGALMAHKLGVPLSAFWQTDLPLYARKRAAKFMSVLPGSLAGPAASAAERFSSAAVNRFYKVPRMLFAPNPEIVGELSRSTGKVCSTMGHGVDAAAFHPGHRDRKDGLFTIGYVGRLTAEKNVRWLALLEEYLLKSGSAPFRIVVVGEGAEETWLRGNLKCGEFTGVLRGQALSRAYANMDLFVFPSETETFGLVVLEALASGVPAVVTARGGPKYTVRHGVTGYVANNLTEFCEFAAMLMASPQTRREMGNAGRVFAEKSSWTHAFEGIYGKYADHLSGTRIAPRCGELAEI
ncbi:MAG TPA: glycosyltransferase, partial [Acidobacteriaceae bacterium]|nr:glycosyltransferase [Acidobacteriaceae bacterium]